MTKTPVIDPSTDAAVEALAEDITAAMARHVPNLDLKSMLLIDGVLRGLADRFREAHGLEPCDKLSADFFRMRVGEIAVSVLERRLKSRPGAASEDPCVAPTPNAPPCGRSAAAPPDEDR